MRETSYRTVFGPVASRRLGRSLGVDCIPRKLCTLDCVYCEVGRTDKRGFARKEYVPSSLILHEIADALGSSPDTDCITFSGSGEPTLNAALGILIGETHHLTRVPVAVLTNGTLLWRDDVRDDLKVADIVCPSLNAVSEDIFRRINRPHPELTADLVLEGLIAFREEYKGKYFLEILFVRGLNDSDEELELLRRACRRIGPDRIHINTVIRPPAESWAKPVPYDRLSEIREFLGPTAEVLIDHDVPCAHRGGEPGTGEILAMLSRRPMSREEIAVSLSAEIDTIGEKLDTLVSEGAVHPVSHSGREFFVAAQHEPAS